MSSFGAVLDACVLVPAATRDTLLRAAEVGMYRPFWSGDIIAELARTLVRLFRERADPEAEAKAERLIAAMRAQFPEANVVGYERLVPAMTNDPKDRHVVAAAAVAEARVIVTENLKDFPARSLLPHQLAAMGADEFLRHLFVLNPATICTMIAQQGADLRRPRTLDEQLRSLARQLPGLASAVRAYVAAGLWR